MIMDPIGDLLTRIRNSQ